MKRQLPQWMLGVPSNPQKNTGVSSRNSGDKDIEDGSVESEPKGIKKRKQPSRNNLDNDVELERVEKKRKGSKNKSDRTSKIEEKATEREDKEIVDPVDSLKGKPPRHPLVKCKERKRDKENVSSYDEMSKNEKKSGEVKNVVDVASTECLDDEDDIDLTVEDLMIIANEYIQEENNSKQVESSKKEHVSVKNQSQGIAAGSRFTESTERNHCSNSNVDPTRNGNSFDSENPTQSMLDLFLGPWLKKTQEEEAKKFESKTSDNLDFEFEAYKQKNALVEEKPVTTTTTTTTTFGKKKSSLKDKVMMFLD